MEGEATAVEAIEGEKVKLGERCQKLGGGQRGRAGEAVAVETIRVLLTKKTY